MRDNFSRRGYIWTPTRRELIRTAGGMLAAGLLVPRIARAATFALVSHTVNWAYNTDPTLDSTGADLLVAMFAGLTADLSPDFSGIGHDSKGNIWVQAIAANESTSPSYLSIWYCANPSYVGAGHYFNYISGTSNYPSCEFACFSGSLLSSPLDSQSSSNSSTGSSVQPGSITPSMGSELVISGVSCRSDASAPTVSGMTLLDAINKEGGWCWASGLAYQIQTTSAAVNPTWTADAGIVAATVAFKSSSGSAPVRRRFIGGE
jgi:hypothetical protein